MIGTAPVHLLADPAAAINKPLLVYSKAEAIAAVGYSDDFASFTLCEAISASFAVVNVAPLVLINVLDPAKHSAEMEEKTVQINSGVAVVEETGVLLSTLVVKNGEETLTAEEDYTAVYNADGTVSIVLIEGAGIRARGGVGFFKSLAAPTPVMTPMNILEIAIRPTSLCMRLFGNVLGAFVIMELIKLVVPVFVPAVFSLYFDLFDGLIQTYVFVFLTSLFMKETMGGED